LIRFIRAPRRGGGSIAVQSLDECKPFSPARGAANHEDPARSVRVLDVPTEYVRARTVARLVFRICALLRALVKNAG
jgi:hypothetical protein